MSLRSSGTCCAVRGCTNNQTKLNLWLQQQCFEHAPKTKIECPCDKRYSFHRLPTDEESKKMWLKNLNLKRPPKTLYVCSFHFVDKKPTEENSHPTLWLGYDKPPEKRRRILRRINSSVMRTSRRRSDDPESPDYVPSWFEHTTTAEKERLMAAMRRYRRRQGARVREAAGRPMSAVELAALECLKNGLLPLSSDRNIYSLFPSLCQEYVKQTLMESQTSSGSSEIPASITPAARPMSKVSPRKRRRWSEANKSREENPYLRAWLRHDYDHGKKPKRVDILSHLSTNGTLNIPSDKEVTLHPTRLHEDYCAPKSVKWATGVWKKISSCAVLTNLYVKAAMQSTNQLAPTTPAPPAIPLATGKWEWLSLDVRGPLPETAQGHRFMLIVTDLHSKWTEARPLKTSCAREVALNIRNLVCQLGLPQVLFTQLSRMFIKAVNKALGIYMAMEDCSLVVFHPKACSLDPTTFNDVNRMVRLLVTEQRKSWDTQLRSCLFALHIKQHPDTRQSPFFTLYRRHPRKDPSTDTPPELPVGLSDDHPISRILASPPLIDTQHEPQTSRPPASLQAQMHGDTVVMLSAIQSDATGGPGLGGGVKHTVGEPGKGPCLYISGLQGGASERDAP